MCQILPEQTAEHIETMIPCSKSKSGRLCISSERYPARPKYKADPGLVDDDDESLYLDSSSPPLPTTPDSANFPPHSMSHHRRTSSDKYRVKTLRSPSRPTLIDNVAGRSQSGSSSSQLDKVSDDHILVQPKAARPSSYRNEANRSGPTSRQVLQPTDKSRRRRLKPEVHGAVQPNPPPGSSSSTSRSSSSISGADIDQTGFRRSGRTYLEQDHESDLKNDHAPLDKAKRREIPTSQQRPVGASSSSGSERETPFDYVTPAGRSEDLRRRKRSDNLNRTYGIRQAGGDYTGSEPGKKYESLQHNTSGKHQRTDLRGFAPHVDESVGSGRSSGKDRSSDAEQQRRRDTLREQMLRGKASEERAARHSKHVESPMPARPPTGGARPSSHPLNQARQDARAYDDYYDEHVSIAPNYSSQQLYGDDARLSDTFIGARGLQRSASQRQKRPPNASYWSAHAKGARRQSFSDPAIVRPPATSDAPRPGSSSNNPMWVLDADARRQRGEHVLQESRQRAANRERLELLEHELRVRQAQRASSREPWPARRSRDDERSEDYPMFSPRG